MMLFFIFIDQLVLFILMKFVVRKFIIVYFIIYFKLMLILKFIEQIM